MGGSSGAVRHRPPGLRRHAGLVGEPDHDGVVAGRLGVAHRHLHRRGDALGPPRVVEHRHRQSDRRQVHRARDHDDLVEPRTQRLPRPRGRPASRPSTTASCFGPVAARRAEPLPRPRRQHHAQAPSPRRRYRRRGPARFRQPSRHQRGVGSMGSRARRRRTSMRSAGVAPLPSAQSGFVSSSARARTGWSSTMSRSGTIG